MTNDGLTLSGTGCFIPKSPSSNKSSVYDLRERERENAQL